MPLEDLLKHLQRLAEHALTLWELPALASVRLINVSENATYLVEASGGYKAVLRVHRENYQTRRAIECELAWLDALCADEVVTAPGYYLGRNGRAIQVAGIDGLDAERYLVLFHFVDGRAPDESGDMTGGFEELGAIAARCHGHVQSWVKPEPFERLTWDVDAVFGAAPTWGDWRDAPEVDADVRATLEQVEATIRERLASYGKAPDRYNLIHADMRLANLLVDDSGTCLIDFDDCGHGWFMYDFAAAISFIEDDPRIPDLKAAWLRGYRGVRRLSAEDEAEIETFVMLRRMALLAWIGSHIEAPEPRQLAAGFAAATARLGADYLKRMGKPGGSSSRSQCGAKRSLLPG
jgi:Ser/Thr protein kinase RdoA (MazF antagonist)